MASQFSRLDLQFEISLPSRKKQKKGKSVSDIEKPRSEPAYEEIMHLPPEAGHELIELLA